MRKACGAQKLTGSGGQWISGPLCSTPYIMLYNSKKCIFGLKRLGWCGIDRHYSGKKATKAIVTTVILLTERDWRTLPRELVMGKTRKCTWSVELAIPHPKTALGTTKKPLLNLLLGSTSTAAALRRSEWCMKEAGQISQSGWWHALFEPCRSVVHRAAVSSATPDTVDPVGHREIHVSIRCA